MRDSRLPTGTWAGLALLSAAIIAAVILAAMLVATRNQLPVCHAEDDCPAADYRPVPGTDHGAWYIQDHTGRWVPVTR